MDPQRTPVTNPAQCLTPITFNFKTIYFFDIVEKRKGILSVLIRGILELINYLLTACRFPHTASNLRGTSNSILHFVFVKLPVLS